MTTPAETHRAGIEARQRFAQLCARNADTYRRMAAEARAAGHAISAETCDRMAANWDGRAQDDKAMV